MIHIDRLSIRLPHFMAQHAALVARQVGEMLAAADIGRSGDLAHLAVGPLQIDTGATASEVAVAISAGVVEALARPQR